MTTMISDLDDGDGFIHLYLLPERPWARLERVAHPPAQADRDHEGE